MTIVLNPYSVALKKHPFMEISGNPLYTNGDYKIYHYSHYHYVHTFKNIVICERVKANRELIDNLVSGNKPTEEAALYHDWERPREAIGEGMKAAKRLNFKIV